MSRLDTDGVAVRELATGYEGLFATRPAKAGETIFVERFAVYESLSAPDGHIPVVVRLALRIQMENHFDRLQTMGMRADCWTLGVDADAAPWLKRLVSAGAMSEKRMRDAYCIAAAYNIRCQTVLRTGPAEVSMVDRAVIAPLTCKANHSCEPNTFLWPASSLEEVRERVTGLVAARDIKEGDELTFSYPGESAEALPEQSKGERTEHGSFLDQVQTVRKTFLRERFGFECVCMKWLRGE